MQAIPDGLSIHEMQECEYYLLYYTFSGAFRQFARPAFLDLLRNRILFYGLMATSTPSPAGPRQAWFRPATATSTALSWEAEPTMPAPFSKSLRMVHWRRSIASLPWMAPADRWSRLKLPAPSRAARSPALWRSLCR